MPHDTPDRIPTIDAALKFDDHICRVCGEKETGLWVADLAGATIDDCDTSFVCIRCITQKCYGMIRRRQGALARFRLMERAEEKGQAWDGNYEIVYLYDPSPRCLLDHHRFDFYYRGKVVTMYTPGLDRITHAENEYSGTPRTQTLQTVNEHAIAMWKRRKEVQA